MDLFDVKKGQTVYFESFGEIFKHIVFSVSKKTIKTKDKNDKVFKFVKDPYKNYAPLHGDKTGKQTLHDLTQAQYENFIELNQKKKNFRNNNEVN